MTRIIVNGMHVETLSVSLSYDDVLRLAGKVGDPTVVYEYRGGAGGEIKRGDRIGIADGLVIDATHTGKA